MDNPTNGYLKTNSLLLSYISTKKYSITQFTKSTERNIKYISLNKNISRPILVRLNNIPNMAM